MAEKEKAKDECRNKWVRNRLGLIGRTEKALNYDPYFMKRIAAGRNTWMI